MCCEELSEQFTVQHSNETCIIEDRVHSTTGPQGTADAPNTTHGDLDHETNERQNTTAGDNSDQISDDGNV